MRVIAGEFRSRILKEVESDKTRETKDRVKESVFNSLVPYLVDANVLDLFAGSGALGIEALSRGSKHATFVDLSLDAYNVIKHNIDNLELKKQSLIFNRNYNTHLYKTEEKYDVILLDPPYDLVVLDDCIKMIQESRLLTKNGIIVCLYSKNSSLKEDSNGIIEYKQKKIGVTKVSFMKWGI